MRAHPAIMRAPGALTARRAPRGAPRNRLQAPLAVAIALVASVAVAFVLGTTDQWILPVAAVAGAAAVAFALYRPAVFLLAFLVARPLLDEFSKLTLGVPGANVSGVLSLLLLLLVAALVLRRPSALAWPPVGAWALLVAVTGGLSVYAMWDFGGTVGLEPMTEAIRLLSVLAMYVLAMHVFRGEERLRKLVVVIGLSGIFPALWGLIELPTLAATAGETEFVRVSGPFVGPNGLGEFLAFTILVLVGMPRAWLSTRVRLLALLPQVVALVPTYSRVGWAVTILGVALLEYRNHKRLVAGLVVVVMAVVALVPTVRDRVLPSSTPTAGAAPTYESYEWRMDNWRTLLDKWTEHPLTGYGTGTTIYVNPRRTTERQLAPDGGFEAHNSVVRILVEGGLALMAVYLLWGVVLYRSLRAMRRARWDLAPVARVVAILWLLFVLVGLATDDPFASSTVLFVLFAITGALEGTRLARRAAEERSAGPSQPVALPASSDVLRRAGA